MNAHELLPLSSWESFYVIVGSSAGALTGLMFVVITLIADIPRAGSSQSIAAYGTPTVVHFCTALLISAVLSAPWPSATGPSWTLAGIGVFGVGYVAIVTRRATKQHDYKPVLEDWIWHTLLPFVAYAVLIVSGFMLHVHAGGWLFGVGAVALLLLFIGIHNSWDTVTFLALDFRQRQAEQQSAANTPTSAPPTAMANVAAASESAAD